MANMSYCQFENTLADLKDCVEAMEEGERLSESEGLARQELIELCVEIAETYNE